MAPNKYFMIMMIMIDDDDDDDGDDDVGPLHSTRAKTMRACTPVWKLSPVGSGRLVVNTSRPLHHSRCVAVEDLVLSQEDKPKSSRDLHRIIDRNLSSDALNDNVLSCRLKPIASPVSSSDKQPYQLQ